MAPESACKPAPPALVLQTAEGPEDPLTSHSGYCVGDIWIMTDGTFYGIGAGGADGLAVEADASLTLEIEPLTDCSPPGP